MKIGSVPIFYLICIRFLLEDRIRILFFFFSGAGSSQYRPETLVLTVGERNKKECPSNIFVSVKAGDPTLPPYKSRSTIFG